MDVRNERERSFFPFSQREKEGPAARRRRGRMRGYGVSGESSDNPAATVLKHRNPSPSQPSAGALPLPLGEVFR